VQANPEPAAPNERSPVTDQPTVDDEPAEPSGKKGKKAKGKKKKQIVAESDDTPAVEPAAPETVPAPTITESPEQTAASDAIEPVPVEAPPQDLLPEPASSSKKSKKKKKKQANQDLSEPPVEVSTEQSAPVPNEEPKLEVTPEQAPPTDSPLPAPISVADIPATEDPSTSQADASPQPQGAVETTASSKKSKKKKKRASLSLDTETPEATAPPSTSEDAVPAPETTTHHQAEVSAESVVETKPEIGSPSRSEAEKSVSFTTDDQPSTPRDKAQEDGAAHTEDTEDPLTAAQGKKDKKKKKRQSVSFAEPLEEHLGSATTGGEDDNNHQQETKDSKDPISEVLTVPPQNGDSVDERPAQSEAQSPSAQVGVTVPLPNERDVRGADFDMQQQQEPTEPPASRSLDRLVGSETAGEVAVGQESRLSDESQPHAADESK
jgi:hypothetical protein